MRIHILGLGSIGSLVAHHLRTALPKQHDVVLIHKNIEYAFAAKQHGGLTIERDGVQARSSGFHVEDIQSKKQYHISQSSSQQPTNVHDRKIHSLIVTTKANHTIEALKRVRSRLAPHCTIVLLQNGMGMHENISENLFRNPLSRPHFILSSNTHGVTPKRRYHFVHAGWGELQFGIVPDSRGRNYENGFSGDNLFGADRAARLADIADPAQPDFPIYQSLRNTMAALLLLTPLRPSWVPYDQVVTAMRRKLVVNSIINPLSAIMNCKNGDLFKCESSMQLMRRMCIETSRIFAAQDAEKKQDEENEEEFDILDSAALQRSTLTADSLEKECLRVANVTSQNYSSMLNDVYKGKDTEINHLNGYLLNEARKYGVHCPTTLTVTQMLNMRRAIPLDADIK
jgi:2-dehydropantoate 2-reductase